MSEEERNLIVFLQMGSKINVNEVKLKKEDIKILANYIDKLQKENEILRNRIDRVLKKLDTGDYVAYTAYGDLLYEDIELIEILKGEKE